VRGRAERALRESVAGGFAADATREMYEWCMPGPRGRTIHYGLDLEALDARRAQLDRASARTALGLARDARLILCLGTIDPRKAQVPLAQAFGELAAGHPDAVLACVGSKGDEFAATLGEYVRGCLPDGRVRIEPIVEDVIPWIAAADVVVSASDLESMPRVLIEAMLWERAVLATAIYGIPEVVDHGRTGWLCPPRDVRALADALDRVLKLSDKEREHVGRAARARVLHRHNMRLYSERYAELLATAAAAPGRA
jgi:glycosyltransferase involved in cell wall biosynthesis